MPFLNQRTFALLKDLLTRPPYLSVHFFSRSIAANFTSRPSYYWNPEPRISYLIELTYSFSVTCRFGSSRNATNSLSICCDAYGPSFSGRSSVPISLQIAGSSFNSSGLQFVPPKSLSSTIACGDTPPSTTPWQACYLAYDQLGISPVSIPLFGESLSTCHISQEMLCSSFSC